MPPYRGAFAPPSRKRRTEVQIFPTASGQSEVHELAAALYSDKHRYLLTIARRNAVNEVDAEEALQEAFANFIRAFDPSSEAPPLAWLTTTLKRQCWRQRREAHFDRYLAESSELDSMSAGSEGTEERVVNTEEARARLAQLKPDERTALGLQAAGLSYREIGRVRGWTYTKVNRCISEGRAALRAGGMPIGGSARV